MNDGGVQAATRQTSLARKTPLDDQARSTAMPWQIDTRASAPASMKLLSTTGNQPLS